ncbi:MAG: hypothetical protein AMDU2_EPLC00008G0001 [Thermoplasmatales archaeon E-plasma]|jgi:hypothetical protein|nr:MAG: hypothetical protein AMDU2_EPLC00008G0001 [Thermoplasmatales archaeon E-plasma]EQB69912.1 MAG: hypothetical protein AMDU5_GPLC00001G0130 [Thermoplasmatales archaeon Gpl]
MKNEFEIEPISVKRNVIVKREHRHVVNEVIEGSGIEAISEQVYTDAFHYAQTTGKDVVVQGAKIQISIADTGVFRKHREIQVVLEMPSIRL